MATRRKSAPATEAAPAESTGDAVSTVKHRAKRKNIPPAGLEAQGRVEEAPRVRLDCNSHLSPRLRFSDDPAQTDRLPELLATARQRALTEDEARLLADALRKHEPWLEWAGKRERPWTEVEALALHPTSRERIATWFVDTDHDSRSVCICQAFSPDGKKWDELALALGAKGVVDESRFDELTGFVTLPFARPPTLPRGKPWRVAVKVIDPRGNEGLRVVTMPEPR